MVNSTAPWVGTMLHVTILLVGFFLYPSIHKGVSRIDPSRTFSFVLLLCLNMVPTLTVFSLTCCWIADAYQSVAASIAFVVVPGAFIFLVAFVWFCCESEVPPGRRNGLDEFRGGTQEFFEQQVSHRTIALEMVRAAADLQAQTGYQVEKSPYIEERSRSLQR